MHIYPAQVPFERLLANRQIIFAAARGFVLEKVFDFGAVVGVNAFAGRVLLAFDEAFGGAFHHLGEFARTPHGKIFAARRHSHQHDVVVQRVKYFFVKARLEVQHEINPLGTRNQELGTSF